MTETTQSSVVTRSPWDWKTNSRTQDTQNIVRPNLTFTSKIPGTRFLEYSRTYLRFLPSTKIWVPDQGTFHFRFVFRSHPIVISRYLKNINYEKFNRWSFGLRVLKDNERHRKWIENTVDGGWSRVIGERWGEPKRNVISSLAHRVWGLCTSRDPSRILLQSLRNRQEGLVYGSYSIRISIIFITSQIECQVLNQLRQFETKRFIVSDT